MQIVVALVFLAVWLMVFWFGSIAFEATGLERGRARFQALSALTGTGFTTREAELVVNHPRRRTVAACLIFLGNAGIISFLILLIAYVRSGVVTPSALFIGIVVLVVILLILSIRFGVVNAMTNAILIVTRRKAADHYLETDEILHEAGRYAVVRLAVAGEATGMALEKTGLLRAGVSVLAIERKDGVAPFPGAEQQVSAGDHLLCYGEIARITGTKRQWQQPYSQ